MTSESEHGIRLSEAQQKRRRSRSIAIALSLCGLAILFFAMTIVKFGPAFLAGPQ